MILMIQSNLIHLLITFASPAYLFPCFSILNEKTEIDHENLFESSPRKMHIPVRITCLFLK